jgi:hypothetical protein
MYFFRIASRRNSLNYTSLEKLTKRQTDSSRK